MHQKYDILVTQGFLFFVIIVDKNAFLKNCDRIYNVLCAVSTVKLQELEKIASKEMPNEMSKKCQ